MNQPWIKARRWGLGGVVAVLAAALMAACGGGGSSSSDGTTATTFASGPISGFGSIIVDGVRFDDSGAEIENEDGERGGSDDLQLGTMVEIEGGAIDDSTGRAKALRIRFGSEIVGPVASVASDSTSLVVLGQTVELRPETVVDDSLPADPQAWAGLVVEVHALMDASTGHYVATRIEDKDNALLFKLRGVVAELDTTAQTFKIGDALISYAGVTDLPALFDDGLRVRVRLQTTQVEGKWVAVSIRSGVRKVEDHDVARLRGTVTDLTDETHFEVNGVPVNASAARIDDGPVTAGARVEVRGTAKDGTVIATRVKVLDEDDDAIRGIELHGTVGDLNTEAKTFVLRGVTVDYSGTLIFKDGAEADLADGVQVEVKGRLSTDRSTLTAVLIEFED
ncbi:DUF5666 domain-containing protein [Piscinibacter defluvii]|uniref:DUF5666 domain-containing protein n=1 Tax=Piscinibacter defluvii TaxID=1796922 RepID=UPI000FDEE7C6|nr:DUF5666 domain-containing protein [Piscinibacter defluvii]